MNAAALIWRSFTLIVVICSTFRLSTGQPDSVNSSAAAARHHFGKNAFRGGSTARANSQQHTQHPALASLQAQTAQTGPGSVVNRRQLLDVGSQWGQADPEQAQAPRPTASAISVGEAGRPTLYNVLMRSQQELLFYVPSEDAAVEAAKHLPSQEDLVQDQYWPHADWAKETVKIHIVPPSKLDEHPDTCYRWVDEPAVWYSGSPIDHNPFHFLTDNVIPLLSTLADNRLFDINRFMARDHLPSSEESNLMILQRRASSLAAPYTWLLDHITPDIHIAEQEVGSCFSSLLIGVDHRTRPYGRPWEDEVARKRRDATTLHRQFAVEAIRRTHAWRGWRQPVQFPRGEGGRTRIGWVSRPQKAFMSRAVLNEDAVVQMLRERYDADVSVLTFKGGPEGLGEAVEATQGLDIFIGMHGAGMTNLLWMQPGAVVVQLLAYGWQSADPTYFPNAVLFEQPAVSLGLTHLQWVNTDPQNAFFKSSDFANKTQFVEHPDDSTPLPLDKWRDNRADKFWQFQDTIVDISTLIPITDEAVQLVNGKLSNQAAQSSSR